MNACLAMRPVCGERIVCCSGRVSKAGAKSDSFRALLVFVTNLGEELFKRARQGKAAAAANFAWLQHSEYTRALRARDSAMASPRPR